MKTLIVGAGVIGTIYGWAFAEAGVDVTHYVRPGKGAILDHQIQIDVLDERKGHKKNNLTTYPIRWTESVSSADGYELVIVPTNAFQVETAIQTLAPACPEAIFLTFAANWEGVECLGKTIPRARLVLGYPDGGGTIREGVYWTNLGGEVHLGLPEGGSSEALEKVSGLFRRTDIQPDVQSNMLHWLWLHNAMSTPFAAGLAKHNDIPAYMKDTAILKQCFAAGKEVIELCERRGVKLDEYPEIVQFKLPVWLFVIIFRLLMRYNKSMERFTAHAVSALPEARYNFQAMLKTAGELGFEMRAMRELEKFL